MYRFALLVLLLPTTGCLVELLTTTAIQGELGAQAASSAVGQLSYAEDEQARISLQQAVNTYAAEMGGFPATLDVLIPEWMQSIPTTADGRAFIYDARYGTVEHPRTATTNAAPSQQSTATFTAQDERNLAALRDGIRNYHLTNRQFPGSLNDLPPLYIDSVPTMSNGQAYSYNSLTGEVYHPAELQAQQQQATANYQNPNNQGYQQQPTQQRSRGSARGQIDSISTDHTRRQLEALEEYNQ